MGTQYSNFVVNTGTAPVLVGSAVLTPPTLAAVGPKEALALSQVDQVVGGIGTPNAGATVVADRLTFDPSIVEIPFPGTPPQVPEVYGTVLGGYAKNGAVLLELSGTTAQTVNLTNTAANTPAATAGDTVFATAYVVRVKNLGTAAVTISPGASNPSPLPALGGTSPTYALPAGSEVLFHSSAGDAISGTACNLTFTPAATTNVAVTVGGA
jgi:hypothetical protein